MVILLIRCMEDAIEEYDDTKELDELSYRIYWINKCIEVVQQGGDKFSIYADSGDFNYADDYKNK